MASLTGHRFQQVHDFLYFTVPTAKDNQDAEMDRMTGMCRHKRYTRRSYILDTSCLFSIYLKNKQFGVLSYFLRFTVFS
jgi:hypothetical protein